MRRYRVKNYTDDISTPVFGLYAIRAKLVLPPMPLILITERQHGLMQMQNLLK